MSHIPPFPHHTDEIDSIEITAIAKRTAEPTVAIYVGVKFLHRPLTLTVFFNPKNSARRYQTTAEGSRAALARKWVRKNVDLLEALAESGKEQLLVHGLQDHFAMSMTPDAKTAFGLIT